MQEYNVYIAHLKEFLWFGCILALIFIDLTVFKIEGNLKKSRECIVSNLVNINVISRSFGG